MEKKKSEIMKIAEELGVNRYKGKNALTKEELVDNIISTQQANNHDKKSNEKQQVENKDISESRDVKDRYLDTADIGCLVAFKIETGKVKSAKIVKRSTSGRKLKVETAYGMEYIVPYDNVLWVKTGTRWPKGVYMLLKGISQEVS
nr:MAG TPA: Rho termination factor, N-terminal domain [Caudoviricetes sp.]